ncbi:BON domain-containing protein [Stieleria varia]|uniref:LysM domain/BON superfamily protein n=1 Tax=Stieleria varia TaxID=2528005 RepID=A0A5C5ZY25_9BACT|nr:BON domain-containing protein [Stieleria varia]TWT92066.1 LysM domain/BON superfamily protein [Stieleria varia]
MRRKYFGWAIAAITVLGSVQAYAGDREIAEQIMTRLKSNRDSGALKDFTLDMKVDQGVVLFRGAVSQAEQKELVLAAAKGIEGISNVVDEVTVNAKAQPKAAAVVKPTAKVASSDPGFSLREALAQEANKNNPVENLPQEVAPGEVLRTAAMEVAQPTNNDQALINGVVSELGKAQKAGQLRGFGVDVKCNNGVIELRGRASSEAQRERIVELAGQVPGVVTVNDSISVPSLPRLPEPTQQHAAVPAQMASTRMTPVAVDPVSQPMQSYGTPAAMAAAPMGVPAMPAQYQMQMAGAPMMGAPMGQPMPMNYGGGVGAPRYDAPNLPNYAWPGYASSPNYAALSYPQQYSPSAWPYIGPFYPYPQVPMGWRKVSLEWDDGWWFLDFTDK